MAKKMTDSLSRLPKHFAYRLDLANYVTPRLLKEQPVHRWFYFPHSFSPQLVEMLFKRWDIKPGALVVDPFVGAGTTLFVARQHGFSGIGIDISPLSVFITNTKIENYNSDSVREAL